MAQSPSEQLPAAVVRSVSALDGVKLQYEVTGGGPPIVLLHGGFAGRVTFSRQRALAEKFRLILPSSRGHDGTDGRLPARFGFDTTEVEDVCAILDHEAIPCAHVIGHSTGGATAFAFARKFPQRVDHLVLIEPTLLSILPALERQRLIAHWNAIIDLGQRDGDSAALRATLEWAGGEAWQRLDEQTKASRLQALASMAHLPAPHATGLIALEVTPDDIRALVAPTLLFYGTASYDFEPAIAQRFRELRPDLPIVVVEGAGHNLHRERPDVVNTTIIDFLSR